VRERGKPETFTEEQLNALRTEFKKWCAQQAPPPLTQQQIGDIIGVSQQTAGRFLRTAHAGVSYQTATAIVQRLGFSGVDAFFDQRGLRKPPPAPSGGAWENREAAIVMGRRMRLRESALRRVVERFAEDRFKARDIRFWLDRFQREHDDEEEHLLEVAAPPGAPTAEHKRKRRVS
jgi:hypothetical protein